MSDERWICNFKVVYNDDKYEVLSQGVIRDLSGPELVAALAYLLTRITNAAISLELIIEREVPDDQG